MTQNSVQSVTLEDFHQELECQRFARRSTLLHSILGENFEDVVYQCAEVDCQRSAAQ